VRVDFCPSDFSFLRFLCFTREWMDGWAVARTGLAFHDYATFFQSNA